MRRNVSVILMAVSVSLLVLVAGARAADSDVLAKIAGKNLTVKDFETFVSTLPVDKQKHISENPQQKETLLRRMVQVKAISEIARRGGLDKDPKVRIQLDNYTDEILTQEYINHEIAKFEPTETDLKQYYKVNESSFKTPEMVRARHILIKVDNASSEGEKILARAKSKEKAEAVLARVKAGEDFAKLVTEFSDDSGSKAKGGDLGFFPKGTMVPEVEGKTFSMKPGEVSDLVETNYGYHIIKLEERKEAGIEPFEKVKDKVKERLLMSLRKDKQAEILEKAMKEAGVEMHTELLKAGKK